MAKQNFYRALSSLFVGIGQPKYCSVWALHFVPFALWEHPQGVGRGCKPIKRQQPRTGAFMPLGARPDLRAVASSTASARGRASYNSTPLRDAEEQGRTSGGKT